ncbi:MAG: hypothetical protein HY207_13380 [Nitrospirae bacterium]|nr:hypothetical protein [Nitrospirota bacterium]
MNAEQAPSPEPVEPAETAGAAEPAPEVAKAKPESELSIFQLVQRMNVAAKVKFAFRADKEGRALLLKETSRLVVMAVLNSPKITEQEIEMVAKSRNVSEEVLRVIARKREWIANYAIRLGLVGNPKTPIAIALTHMNSLKTRDLGFLAKDRGVPEAIRLAAQRLARARLEKGA